MFPFAEAATRVPRQVLERCFISNYPVEDLTDDGDGHMYQAFMFDDPANQQQQCSPLTKEFVMDQIRSSLNDSPDEGCHKVEVLVDELFHKIHCLEHDKQELIAQMKPQSSILLSVDTIHDNPKLCRFYTGFPSYDMFCAFFRFP